MERRCGKALGPDSWCSYPSCGRDSSGGPLSSPGWGSDYTWSSIFISWLAKYLILKYGGHRAHSKAAYFFVGLILGDCVIGGAWDMIGVAFNIRTYSF
ncbi:DUF6784 domain-containing protein, partial [Candidatus Poribacteria bacterium]